MKSKWFEFGDGSVESKRQAITINEAWDKTLEKWGLIMDGEDIWRDVPACGLCNLYYNKACKNCPIMKMTGEQRCRNTAVNVNPDPELEYLFLLFVKEATYKGRNK